jgi:hypothetical protein
MSCCALTGLQVVDHVCTCDGGISPKLADGDSLFAEFLGRFR